MKKLSGPMERVLKRMLEAGGVSVPKKENSLHADTMRALRERGLVFQDEDTVRMRMITNGKMSVIGHSRIENWSLTEKGFEVAAGLS